MAARILQTILLSQVAKSTTATLDATASVPSPLDSSPLTFFWMLLVTTLLAIIVAKLVTNDPQRQSPPSRRGAEVQCSLKTILVEELEYNTVGYIRSELKTHQASLKGTKPGLIERLIFYRLYERQIS